MAEKILSVGIDIGTSTTSLVFSNLTIEKTTGDMYMPKTEITDKTVIYRSPIYFYAAQIQYRTGRGENPAARREGIQRGGDQGQRR